MKKIFLLIVFCTSLFARNSLLELQADLNEVLHRVDPKVHVGIEIISLENGQKIYERSSTKSFVPASCLKLFTASAALAILGVDYRFETQLFQDDAGNLYLKGSGDPTLTAYDLDELVWQLKVRHIDEIKGNLVVDNFDFDGLSQGPGWMWDEPAEYWNTPMDAVVIDHNCVSLWVCPAKELAQPAQIYPKAACSKFTIDNRVKTASNQDLNAARSLISSDSRIQVDGTIALESQPVELKVPVADPPIHGGALMQETLQKNGIAVHGEVVRGKTPSKALLLATRKSLPLCQILHRMMKSSDNLYSDCIFKKLGQVYLGAPGTWQKGAQAVLEVMKKEVGINVSELVLLDGCGLSRYNLITPHQLVQLLAWAHGQYRLSSELFTSLPISGVDGSLKGRMLQSKTKVRAKTGTMTGISSIAGYVETKDGELLAFSMLSSGLIQPIKDYKLKIEDEVCNLLAKFSRNER